MELSSCGTFQRFDTSLSLYGWKLPPARQAPKSSARCNLAVATSRPVSIFLRVLTGFFIPFPGDLAD